MATTLKEIDQLKPAANANVAPADARVAPPPSPQPVALEVPVTVNGARTGAEGKREPFSESTNTVLVFGRGAVIRLSSSVAPGQLLFLTNEKNRKEVICQVLKTKSYDNVSGYVELQFTEPANAFWGVRFAEERTITQPTPPAAQSVRQSPPVSTKIESSPLAPPRTIEPKQPAPVVNAQPTPVAAKPSGASTAKPATSVPVASPLVQPHIAPALQVPSASQRSTPAPVSPPPADARPVVSKSAVVVPKPGSIAAESELAPNVESGADRLQPATIPPNLRKPQVDSTLASEEVKIPKWLEPLARNAAMVPERAAPEDVLETKPTSVIEEESPAPQMVEPQEPQIAAPSFTGSFGRTLLGEAAESAEQAMSGAPRKSGLALRIVLIAACIGVVAAAVVWYQRQNNTNHAPSPSALPISVVAADHPSKALTEIPKPQVQQDVNQPNPAASNAAASEVPPNPKSSQQSSSSLPVATDNKTAAESTGTAKSQRPSGKKPADPPKPTLGEIRLAAPTTSSGAVQGSDAGPAPEVNGSAPVESLGGALAATSNKQPQRPPDPLPIGGDVKPAHVIKSVPPVYPLIAKNQRIAGDVKIEAQIDDTGRITTMKVVSGPVLLHQAAMDALRQWKYQPATLDGKPVAMNMSVTIEFRLEQ